MKPDASVATARGRAPAPTDVSRLLQGLAPLLTAPSLDSSLQPKSRV
jgi:hypothetical protein